MLTHEIALTEQELKILQEVQQQLGLSSIGWQRTYRR